MKRLNVIHIIFGVLFIIVFVGSIGYITEFLYNNDYNPIINQIANAANLKETISNENNLEIFNSDGSMQMTQVPNNEPYQNQFSYRNRTSFNERKIKDSGRPDNQSIVITIMGDGFSINQQHEFIEAATDLIDKLLGNPHKGIKGKFPFNIFSEYFTVYAIEVISNESGVSRDSDVNNGKIVDNYFGSSFYYGSNSSNIERALVVTKNSLVEELIKPNTAMTAILCNTTRWGGTGGDFAVLSLSNGAENILAHEFAHSFGKLADEYYYPSDGPFQGREAPNMTAVNDVNVIRWKKWIGYNNVGIIPYSDAVNKQDPKFDPASNNWFKPHNKCAMQSSYNEFCPVCVETLVRQMENIVGSIYNITQLSDKTICIDSFNFTIFNEYVIPDRIAGYEVTKLGDNAFANQTNMTKVVLPSGLVEIGNNAFKNCTKLNTISLNNVEKLGDGAFFGCESLSYINIPTQLTSIGKQAFAKCNNLNISVSYDNPNFSAEDNILYDINKTKILSTGKVNQIITFSQSVSEVGDYAFFGNKNIKTLNFNHNPIIGEETFSNCGSLETVYFYTYEIPELRANSFANNNFALYTPYVCRETYGRIFDGYTANLQSIAIDISFISNGEIIDTINQYYGAIIGELPAPHIKGYQFIGWYDNPDFSGEKYINGGIWDTTENLTLYAKHEVNTYSINFAGAGSGGLASKSVVYGTTVGELPVIEREGYTFLGWKTAAGEYFRADIVYLYESDITLISGWSANTYKVTLNPGDGVLVGDTTFNVTYGEAFSTTAQISRAGYVFEGWFDNNNELYINAAGQGTKLWDKPVDTALTARWSVKSYEIQINDNGSVTWLGASGLSDEKCSIEYGTIINAINLIASYKKSSHGFKYGQIFDHFEYGGDNFNWESVPDLGENNRIVTIIPIWVFEKHIIYFNTRTSVVLNEIQADFGTQITLPNVSRDGYTFKGWYTDVTGVTPVSWTTMPDLTPDDQNNGSITLYAGWENNKYFVEYNANGGSGNMSSSDYMYDVYKQLSINTFTRTGYEFIGWSRTVNGSVSFLNAESVINLTIHNGATVVLYAQWKAKDYTIKLDRQNGLGGDATVVATYNSDMKHAVAPYRTGYRFIGYYSLPNGGGTKYYDSSMNSANKWLTDGGGTLYACWKIIHYTITYENLSGHWGDFVTVNIPNPSENPSSYTIHDHVVFKNPTLEGLDLWWDVREIPSGSTGNKTIYLQWREHTYTIVINAEGVNGAEKRLENILYSDKYTLKYNNTTKATFSHWTLNGNHYSNSEEITVWKLTSVDKGTVYLTAHYNKECVAEGTLITLADGTQKPVEQLTAGDKLLVWNLQTGKVDVAPILFIDSDAAKVYEVINLYFSDGTNVKVINEHAFWDINLNKYVFLRNDASKYIGHWFNKQIIDSNGNMAWTSVQLTDVDVKEEYTMAWSPVTYGHLCYYVNGMLSMPGATEGLINIFDVDSETMQYDAEAMAADIEMYGLFTYEEFAEIMPVSKEVFDAFNGQYLKVSIGKGLISIDDLKNLLYRYDKYFQAGIQ